MLGPLLQKNKKKVMIFESFSHRLFHQVVHVMVGLCTSFPHCFWRFDVIGAVLCVLADGLWLWRPVFSVLPSQPTLSPLGFAGGCFSLTSFCQSSGFAKHLLLMNFVLCNGVLSFCNGMIYYYMNKEFVYCVV